MEYYSVYVATSLRQIKVLPLIRSFKQYSSSSSHYSHAELNFFGRSLNNMRMSEDYLPIPGSLRRMQVQYTLLGKSQPAPVEEAEETKLEFGCWARTGSDLHTRREGGGVVRPFRYNSSHGDRACNTGG